MINFSKNLSTLRSKKRLKLSQIAIELGFSVSQWSNYEQGISYPKFLDLIKIATYFEINEADLIHSDLKLNQIKNFVEDSLIVNNLKDEIIEIQKKLIQKQEEKIIDLEQKLNKSI